jgi:DNA helicase-2/ATP-dependent DNA helicase PcrA
VTFIGSDSSLFIDGDIVEHERFGRGTIISIEGQPPNTTATVEFDNNGSKKLLLRFAKLRKL